MDKKDRDQFFNIPEESRKKLGWVYHSMVYDLTTLAKLSGVTAGVSIKHIKSLDKVFFNKFVEIKRVLTNRGPLL